MIEIVPQFTVSYEGNDTDDHVIETQSLGESLGGASRLYTATAHYCVFGTVERGNYKKQFRCYASIPRDGSYEIPIVIAAIVHEYGLHAPIYNLALKFLFHSVLKAIKDYWTKKSSTEKIVECLAQAIIEQAKVYGDVMTVALNGLTHSNDNLASLHSKLIETIPAMADATRSSGRALVAPVGKSCRSIRQFAKEPEEIVIDEPEAAVIRSNEPLEVDDMGTFKCLSITEVDRDTGHCILNVEGFDDPVVGKISDPTLSLPNNIYTRALNDQTSFQFSAKPVKREGVVKRLYISDATDDS